jgi:Na+/H+ antiporter NhaD/arsenite permease-like protein
LTPLGDPPLFLGFLKGVSFSWPILNLYDEAGFMLLSLLLIFYSLERLYFFPREAELPAPSQPPVRLSLDGKLNLVWLAAVMALVLMSGAWATPVGWEVLGTRIGLPGLLRDVGLLAICLLSYQLTAKQVHLDNQFSWAPMLEVAKLFAGIFVTIIPVIAMLRAGPNGPLAAVVYLVTRPDGTPDPLMYFWVTGLLSAVLDNAPTYLAFFNLAGGDASQLMTPLAHTLTAISAGAVFMGAVTYIGNAPNLMIKAVAEDRGVPMPSFLGYLAWSGAVLLPLFGLLSWGWFR